MPLSYRLNGRKSSMSLVIPDAQSRICERGKHESGIPAGSHSNSTQRARVPEMTWLFFN
jgi:hypothetical protein